MSPSPRPLESPESSSPLVTRVVAAGLRGEWPSPYPLAPWQRVMLRLLGAFPPEIGRKVISEFASFSALDPGLIDGLRLEELVAERLADYAGLAGPFPALTVGAALGGASAHLALALGGPFLPQAFVVTVRGGAPDGDVRLYLARGAEQARRIAADNPQVCVIQHYDPVHDGWVTRRAHHLRFKLLALPPGYERFIRQKLTPGGALVYLDCQARWLRYRIGPRYVFQVGGWGDISAEEFLEGSPRLRRYCASAGLAHTDWRLPGYPLEAGPESEWGCEPGLGEALAAFCRREGYRFVPLTLPQPHDYARLAYLATLRRLEKGEQKPAGVLVEMFSQFDAIAVLRAGLLPLWLVFNTSDSLAFLQEMLPSFPPDKPVFFSPTTRLTPGRWWIGMCLCAALRRRIRTRSRRCWRRRNWRRWQQRSGRTVRRKVEAREIQDT